MMDRVDGWVIFDNSGTKPILVARKRADGVVPMDLPTDITEEWARRAEAAFQAGVRRVIAEHHAAGRPIWVSENGRAVRIDPPAADNRSPRKTAAR